ncbi:MAG: Jag N-terminal domain-containing protein [Clostridia bacterium]|nr:Jag N-terminal domain-containing protein [Clostridia bacterium]
MIKEIIASGKDVAEAKENARALLGAGELDDVQFEIIHAGSKGIFGIIGVKAAQVRAFIELPDAQEKKPRPERHRDRGQRNHGKGGEKSAQHNRPERKETKPAAPKKEKESKPKSVVIPENELKLTPRTVEDGEDMSYEFIKTLIANLGLNASIELYSCEDGTRRVNISGEDASALIGHHGDTLDALQYLANLASAQKNAKGEKDKSRVTIDIEGYRAKREETLRALARRMAAKAIRNNRSVMLEPMSAYERRIIHSEVQGIEGVCTNSIGSDNNRKIVIYLTDKKPKELFEKEEEVSDTALPELAEENGTEKNSLSGLTLDDGETVIEADGIALRGTTQLCDECSTCENVCADAAKSENENA